jgi:hypothetical protein
MLEPGDIDIVEFDLRTLQDAPWEVAVRPKHGLADRTSVAEQELSTAGVAVPTAGAGWQRAVHPPEIKFDMAASRARAAPVGRREVPAQERGSVARDKRGVLRGIRSEEAGGGR